MISVFVQIDLHEQVCVLDGADDLEKHWLRRMGPGHFAHINFKGTIAFNVDPYADVLLQGSERNRARAQA